MNHALLKHVSPCTIVFLAAFALTGAVRAQQPLDNMAGPYVPTPGSSSMNC